MKSKTFFWQWAHMLMYRQSATGIRKWNGKKLIGIQCDSGLSSSTVTRWSKYIKGSRRNYNTDCDNEMWMKSEGLIPLKSVGIFALDLGGNTIPQFWFWVHFLRAWHTLGNSHWFILRFPWLGPLYHNYSKHIFPCQFPEMNSLRIGAWLKYHQESPADKADDDPDCQSCYLKYSFI